MTTTPEEFQQRLAEAKKRTVCFFLLTLTQVACVTTFATVCRPLPAFSYYFSLAILIVFATFSIRNYVQHLRFLKVYGRCVALITRFEQVSVEQVNMRASLQEQLEAEVEKLSKVTGIKPDAPDENVPD